MTRSGSRTRATGTLFAVAAAASFSLSGTVGSGLMTSGWSAGAAVCARMLIGCLVLLPLALVGLRGRAVTARGAAPTVLAYGLVAVAGAQLSYFQAVRYLPVTVALLVEFTAPVAVLLWLWMVRGQRPSRATLMGAVLCVLGVVVVLDLGTGADVDPRGIAWAVAAMMGVATYYLLSASETHGLPPVALASFGLGVGGAVLLLAGAVGILELRIASQPAVYAGVGVPPWAAAAVLGVVTAGLAYLFGIEGSRRLGARAAGFVGLVEILFVAAVAWLLLGQTPTVRLLLGGALVMTGIVLVQLGERRTEPVELASPEMPQ